MKSSECQGVREHAIVAGANKGRRAHGRPWRGGNRGAKKRCAFRRLPMPPEGRSPAQHVERREIRESRERRTRVARRLTRAIGCETAGA